jgi:hypothetical protein
MEKHISRGMHHQKSKNENKFLFFFSFYVVLAFDPIDFVSYVLFFGVTNLIDYAENDSDKKNYGKA